MTDEQTPLLSDSVPTRPSDVDSETQRAVAHQAVYSRFSEKKKAFIVFLVSWAGLIPFFVSGSFVPSIPQIARDFDTTGAVVNLAVSLSILASAIGSLTWARYSGYYGRRPVYLAAFPILILGSLGVARSRSVTELYAWRVVQAFGSGVGFSVGAGVIGDIYKLEERGKAMGIFTAACLLGPAVAPPTGGFVAYYYSWRMMQLALMLSAVIALFALYLWLPETSQPDTRGVDKDKDGQSIPPEQRKTQLVFLNPLKDLALLRSPVILSVCLVQTSVLFMEFLALNPLPYTLGQAFDIHNEAIIGAFFVPAGVGNIIGAPIAGRISDRVLVKAKKRRGGEWVPEDRLPSALIGAGVLVPLAMLFFGLVTTFASAKIGSILILVVLFMNGIGIDFALTPTTAYTVDIMHHKSAEIMAATSCLRGTILALGVSGILPAIERFGLLATYTAAAILSWLAFGLLLVTIKYGDRMRAWIDIGYSTPATN
ncbi:MFS general substrate transporter [Peniophora sp. CONT]|nr:MFS general substrate transporter [Peniophora sp. CONT]